MHDASARAKVKKRKYHFTGCRTYWNNAASSRGKKNKKNTSLSPYTPLTLFYVGIIRGNAIKFFGKYLTTARWYTACIFIFVETRQSREKAKLPSPRTVLRS